MKNKEGGYWLPMFYMVMGTFFAVSGLLVSLQVNLYVSILTILLGIATFIFGFLSLSPKF
jgi:hypothetical protein